MHANTLKGGCYAFRLIYLIKCRGWVVWCVVLKISWSIYRLWVRGPAMGLWCLRPWARCFVTNCFSPPRSKWVPVRVEMALCVWLASVRLNGSTGLQARWNMFFAGGAEFSKMSSAKRDVISARGPGPAEGPRELWVPRCSVVQSEPLFDTFRSLSGTLLSCHFGNDYTGMYIINCKM